MANWKLKDLRDDRRRTFLKMCGVAAAAVGIDRSRMLNFLADEGGSGLAEAAISSYGRTLIVPAANGVQAWFQELWPLPDVALKGLAKASIPSGNIPGQGSIGNYGAVTSYLYTAERGYAPGNGYRGTYVGPSNANLPAGATYLQGEREMFYSPDAPWFDHAAGKPKYAVTGIMCGEDETHTEFPTSSTKLSGSSGLLAVAGALAAVGSSAIIPVLGIDPVKYGSAPGAPDVATVPNANGLVDLFNSAASQFTLFKQGDQDLFSTYYKALVGLRRSHGRSSWAPEMVTTKNAAKIIGLNFSTQLTPTAEDLVAFGVTDVLNTVSTSLTLKQREGLEAFARALIVVSKAFRLGLSKSAIVSLSPGPTSEQTFTDPHVTFDSQLTMMQGRNVTKYLGKALDAFYADLATANDPESPDEKLDQNTTFIAYGDTPHTALVGATWPDATPDDANYLWAMDPKGILKSGWFGQMYAMKKGGKNAQGFNPETGAEITMPTAGLSGAACTAIAHAIAKGDSNKVSEFGGPTVKGMINKV
ncbi:MAG: twin-arginine translocation signal domain-containing protein [Myxococcales bacterium]|nr:twin-arginine translocation signal domain-containing protein [Myxococcales bacterium]